MRREYAREALAEADVDADPVAQFGRWFEQATQAGLLEPSAMTLATATPDGRPSARMVLLRGFDERGFCFYTNSRAALVFWWDALERQVRIEGRVEPTSRAESEAYFASRPPGSQLSAAASPQSRVIDRATLERRVTELATSVPEGEVPLPDFWGGYRLTPEVVEFWQGRPDRLHDRLRYRRAGDGWVIERLAP
jgi:pyridoxamine 5'-phosphate oxidase